MDRNNFKNTLKDIASYIFNYGLRKMRQGEETLEEVFVRIGPEAMRRKDFEGFVYAQEKIIKSILSIEDELIILRAEKRKYEKGKHKREIYQDPNYIKLSEKEGYLMVQEAAIKEMGNSIAWILFGGARGYLRRCANPNSVHGYLRDKNWKSVMKVVSEINEEPDTFALLSDITSVVGIGDILVWDPRGIRIIEVKEGKIAQRAIQEIPEQKREYFIIPERGEYTNGVPAIENTQSFIKQIERQSRQAERIHRFKKILLTNEGKDPISGECIRIIDDGCIDKGEQLNSIIGCIVENPPKKVLTDTIPLLLPTDCYLIGVTGIDSSEFVRQANFQHAIYHTEKVPWENCDYILPSSNKIDRDIDNAEPQVYLSIQFKNLRDSIFIPTHCPLYLLIGVNAAIKLISGEISVFLKFYPEKFRNICENLGIKTRWINEQQLNRYVVSTKLKKDNFVKFPNGYLELEFKNNYTTLSTSMFYSMIYELKTGRNIALQIKKFLEKLKER